MPTRNVILSEHQQQLVESLVQSGRYQNASEVLREGLRLPVVGRILHDAMELARHLEGNSPWESLRARNAKQTARRHQRRSRAEWISWRCLRPKRTATSFPCRRRTRVCRAPT
jgi:Arc/MetJ-type ribon-helix-helix transcriptional regulator